MDVLKFLFGGSDEKCLEQRIAEFKTVWTDYTTAVREVTRNKTAVLTVKERAEVELFSHIARTERGGENDAINEDGVGAVKISPDDIATYIELSRAFESVDMWDRIYEDYVKSCPFPLSYMREYKLKKTFEAKSAAAASRAIGELKKYARLLWIDNNKVRRYERLEVPNARFVELEQRIFEQDAQNLLWVPPSKTYYKLRGAYKGKRQFSKTLVFSVWEMVPRMIASLLSYESERRLREGKEITDENGYFETIKRKRQLLAYKTEDGKARNLSLFTLLYPSQFLADVYNPIEYLNKGIDEAEVIRDLIKEKIQAELDELKSLQSEGRGDAWYYLAPMIIDYRNDQEYIKQWLKGIREAERKERDENERDEDDERGEGKRTHLKEIEQLLDDTANSLDGIGTMPDDLADILADSAMGSFAVCALRALKNPTFAFRIAEVLRKRFNTPRGNRSRRKQRPAGKGILAVGFEILR